MQYTKEYGVATNIRITLLKATGGFLLGADWTPAAGEVVVIKDGVLDGNIDTLPTFVTSSLGVWNFPISATEAECLDGQVVIVASPLASDAFSFTTIPFGAIGVAKLSAVASNTITFPNVAPWNTYADNQIQGNYVYVHGGTGKGQAMFGIKSHVGRVATLDRTPTITLDTTSLVTVYPSQGQGTDPDTFPLVDARKINNTLVQGNGTSGNLWRG